MRDINSGQVDLWLAFPEEIHNKQLLDQYYSLLSEQERERIRRFHFSSDQHHYLVTRALTRVILSKYAPIAPEHWLFLSNAYGKPEIANDDRTAKKLSFNISHTHGLIVLGITYQKMLGVDAENIRVRQAPIELARSFFSAEEIDVLHALPADLQHDYFFQCWTLKEAYSKARGVGLSTPLEKCSFHLRNETQTSIPFSNLWSGHQPGWHFWQYRVAADFLMAICVEHAESMPPQLNIRKVVPFVKEENFCCSLVREIGK